MSKSECDGECTATPKVERKKRDRRLKTRSQEVNARMSIGSESRCGPDGKSDDSDGKGEGYEGK